MESDVLSAREKAAVLWAQHVTENTARHRDDVFEEVARHFGEAEIVELTLMAGFFAMFNRLTDSLRIAIEIPREVDKIKSSVHVDPAKIAGYFETMAATWPSSFPEPSAEPDPPAPRP